MTTPEAILRVASLVLGVALLAGDLLLVFKAATRSDDGEVGCLPWVAAVFAGFVAVALILGGLAGPQAAVDWLL